MSSRASSPLSSPSRSTSPAPPAASRETGVESKASSSSEPQTEKRASSEKVEDPQSSKSSDDEHDGGDDEAASSVKVGTSTDDAPSSSTPNATPATNALVQGDWQAIWSPQHNMYYFYNMRTNETTWTNPVAGSQAAGPSQTSARYDAEAAAVAQGIDPALAFLDPSLAAGPSHSAAFSFTAKFNSRTGAFTKADARNPDHVSEYERMKRMNSVFFDMDAWQQEVDQRYVEEEEAGKKRKKPTKKDLDTYKERKKQKKLAKTAWLRT